MALSTAMPRPVLLYDADCGFCRWCLGKVLAWDRGGVLLPMPLQDPEAGRLLGGMDRDSMMASWHLVDEDGEAHSAGRAFAPLLRQLPGGRPLAAVTEQFPGAVDRAYRWVADRRSRFGRLVTDGARARAGRRIERRAERS
jgi:predicted DCC family thiol-disulfide oxidoreductase YuxK